MTSVLDAEAELPDESPAPTRQPTQESLAVDEEPPSRFDSGTETHEDRDELNLPPKKTQIPDETADEPAWPLTSGTTVPTETPKTLPSTTQEDDNLVPAPLNISSARRRSIAAAIETSIGTAAAAPELPDKAPRPESFIAEIRPSYTQAPIRRKPVSRAASGEFAGLTKVLSPEKLPDESEDSSSGTSPDTSMSSMTDKMTPLTQSLISLSSRDYLNVELDQPPVQPYPDHPPAYVPTSPNQARATRTRRSNTERSSVSHQLPAIVQLSIENRLNELSALINTSTLR